MFYRDVLVGVADSFSFVGLRFLQLTDTGCRCSDQLFIDAVDDHQVFILLITLDGDAFRDHEFDWMGETKRKIEFFPGNIKAIPDSSYF